MPKLNREQFGAYLAIAPPFDLQALFNQRATEIVTVVADCQFAGSKIEALFDILLHRAFSGDLTAKWREAHMNELLQEMEQQTKDLERGRKQ